MASRSFHKNVFLTISIGFAVVMMVIWLDEFIDLPQILFHASPTTPRLAEALLETFFILLLAGVVGRIVHKNVVKIEIANWEKTKLFSIIAHDLKKLFSTVVSNSNVLQTAFDNLSQEDKYELANTIYHSSKQCYHIVDNLLNWAQSQMNNITFHPVPLVLSEIVEENILLLQEQMRQKDVSCEVDISRNHVVSFDATMLKSVIRNLLFNAVKYSHPHSPIHIRAHDNKNTVVLSISDQGVGIHPHHVKTLMTTTYFSSHPGTAKESGSGIGLQITKEFVARNQGQFSIQSTPNQGTTVQVIMIKSSLA